jgi:hypothetical protein
LKDDFVFCSSSSMTKPVDRSRVGGGRGGRNFHPSGWGEGVGVGGGWGGGVCLFTEYSIMAPDSDLHLEALFYRFLRYIYYIIKYYMQLTMIEKLHRLKWHYIVCK